MKKLRDPAAGLGRFFERADGLGKKLGPILFQLPPNWKQDLDRLTSFLAALPLRHRYAFEFATQAVMRLHLLRQRSSGLCSSECPGTSEDTRNILGVRWLLPELKHLRAKHSNRLISGGSTNYVCLNRTASACRRIYFPSHISSVIGSKKCVYGGHFHWLCGALEKCVFAKLLNMLVAQC